MRKLSRSLVHPLSLVGVSVLRYMGKFIALYSAISQALCTPDLPPPAQILSSNLKVGWNMMYAPVLQSKKGKFRFGRVLWHCRLRYSAIFGAPVLPIRARSLMHTILFAPLHPILAAIYLDGLPTLTTGMNACATACLGPVLVAIAQPHQRVKACGSSMGACMSSCAGMLV